MRLYEGRQYREAANFLQRLPRYTFKAALDDIPVDLIVESLPHSLTLLEAVYARFLDLLDDDTTKSPRDPEGVASRSRVDETGILVRIEQQVLWRVVHHISTMENFRDARIWSKLLVTLSRLSPGTKKLLASRRRSLERAVEGLGKHGLVQSNSNVVGSQQDYRRLSLGLSTFGTSFARTRIGAAVASATSKTGGSTAREPPTSLLPLTAKLREELESRLEAYKLVLHRIESWGKQNASSGCGGGSSGHDVGGSGGGVVVGSSVGGIRSKGLYSLFDPLFSYYIVTRTNKVIPRKASYN